MRIILTVLFDAVGYSRIDRPDCSPSIGTEASVQDPKTVQPHESRWRSAVCNQTALTVERRTNETEVQETENPTSCNSPDITGKKMRWIPNYMYVSWIINRNCAVADSLNGALYCDSVGDQFLLVLRTSFLWIGPECTSDTCPIVTIVRHSIRNRSSIIYVFCGIILA